MSEQTQSQQQPGRVVYLPATGERVLIADDDPNIRQLLALALHADGIEVVCAADGFELIRKAQECQPHLIVADIQMPRMDGFTAIRRLRDNQATAHIPVIILSARSSADDVSSALEFGADEYIVKPFNLGTLRGRIHAYLRQPVVAAEA